MKIGNLSTFSLPLGNPLPHVRDVVAARDRARGVRARRRVGAKPLSRELRRVNAARRHQRDDDGAGVAAAVVLSHRRRRRGGPGADVPVDDDVQALRLRRVARRAEQGVVRGALRLEGALRVNVFHPPLGFNI